MRARLRRANYIVTAVLVSVTNARIEPCFDGSLTVRSAAPLEVFDGFADSLLRPLNFVCMLVRFCEFLF